VLDAGEDGITIADIDWSLFTPAFTVRRPSPLLAGLPEAVRALAEEAIPGDEAAATTLAGRLAGLNRAEQDRVLTDLVRAHAAAVLGHPSTDTVEPRRAFKDLGFDSLAAIELRNRLAAATGAKLPATLIYDYPNSATVAEYLWAEEFQGTGMRVSLAEELDKFESLLARLDQDDSARALVNTRLSRILTNWSDNVAASDSENAAEKLASATDDEIYSFINTELGKEGI
jgi:acyl carrier protein